MPKKCLFFWFFICPLAGYATYFPSERLAINLSLPIFAENTLKNHVLDAFPKGAECHLLLAEAGLLRRDFRALHHHLQRLPRDKDRVWLDVLDGWYNERRLSLTILLFSSQAHPLACFLRDMTAVLHEPIQSVHWACFWGQQYAQRTLQQAELLYQTVLEMKFAIDPQSFSPKQKLQVWQSVAAAFFAQERYEELKTFLHSTLPRLRSSTEKARCLLWLLRTFGKLDENTDDLMRNHASIIDRCPTLRDAIVTEWLASISEPMERVHRLQLFCELYKKKHKTLQMQYLQLAAVHQYLELGQREEAREILGGDLTIFVPSLRASAYELTAKMALTDTPPSYSKAADCLNEARRCTSEPSKRPFYAQLQSDCLCMTDDYHRANCVCEEAVRSAERDAFGSRLAETWCECGILCNETADELKQQLIVCRERSLLSEEMEQQLHLAFAQHHFEQEQFETALSVLESQSFVLTLRNCACLLRAKCQFRLGKIAEASETLNQISTDILSDEELCDYFLWQSAIEKEQGNVSKAQFYLDRFFKLKGTISEDLHAQAILLQADLQAQEGDFETATQTLTDFVEKAPNDWKPFVLFRAADYAEKNGASEAAISLFQKLYESDPQHPLAKDGRLRQGTLLLNLQKPSDAQTLLEALLPNLKDEQALWCRWLIQKCAVLSDQPTVLSKLQLESLLLEKLPRSLRLEIVLQLAILHKEQGQIVDLQTLLWSECSPLFSEEPQTFSVNDLHGFNRCLLLLAQHTHDAASLHRLYELMKEAQLPSALLVKAYLSDE